MKFGIIVSRNRIDGTSSDPYANLYSYLNEMEDLGYDLGWYGHHRFSSSTAFGGDMATEPSAPLAMLAPLMAHAPHEVLHQHHAAAGASPAGGR